MAVTYGTLRRRPFERVAPAGDILGKAKTRWVLSDCAPHVAVTVKRIFPAVAAMAKPPFVFADTAAVAADLNWLLVRYPMLMTPSDLAYLREMTRRHRAAKIEVEKVLQDDWRPPVRSAWRPGWAARHYQEQPAAMARARGGVLCADDVGLGKTFVGIAALVGDGGLPALIVCPRHLQDQWEKRIKAATTLSTHKINTTKPYRTPPVDAVIMAYTQLGGWAPYFPLIKPRSVIYDEVHELRTGAGTETQPILKGMAARALLEQAEMIIGLSATPIWGYGDEIWNIMSFIAPTILGTEEEFKASQCVGRRLINPSAVGALLRDEQVYIRRVKGDVKTETPPVLRTVETIPVDQKTMADAESAARALAIKATTGTWSERGQAARELDLRLRQQTGIAKAPGVVNYLLMLLESGTDKVIVGAWHREVYAILMQGLKDYKPVMYTGSESEREKRASKDAFVKGDSRVILMSLRSGQGIDDLQYACSTVVFAELDWSGEVHKQLIGRVDREGQENYPCRAIFLVSDEGSDPPMIEVNGVKASQAAGIADPFADAPAATEIVDGGPTGIAALVARYRPAA